MSAITSDLYYRLLQMHFSAWEVHLSCLYLSANYHMKISVKGFYLSLIKNANGCPFTFSLIPRLPQQSMTSISGCSDSCLYSPCRKAAFWLLCSLLLTNLIVYLCVSLNVTRSLITSTFSVSGYSPCHLLINQELQYLICSFA